ncbi:MAG: molybdopterin-guanine dinucleotide biosynthesis protein B [Pseudomonadota bacterium]
MIPFQIIGQPGSGKTTLVVDLITELGRSGFTVGSIKHSSHAHELDRPGKDSFLHRQAGASPVTMMARDMAAIYLPKTRDMTPSVIMEQYYSHLDIVLIEGWINGPYSKIEVWRKILGKPLLFPDIPGIRAIVTDDPLDFVIRDLAHAQDVRCFKRHEISDMASFITG